MQIEAKEQLLFVTGSIDAGPPGSLVFEGSRGSCELHDLRHEILTSREITERFPAYQLPSETMAVFQPDGGFLLPERCIVAHVELAQSYGAEIHAQEEVLEWSPTSNGVRVRTRRGVYEAGKLVLTAGAWMAHLAAPLRNLSIPERQVLGWFQPYSPPLYKPNKNPVYNITVDEGRFYGLPIYGVHGMKLGRYHHLDQKIDPNHLGQGAILEDEALLRCFVEKYLPEGAGPTMALVPCIFTNTPDEHFILDFHPEYSQVIMASPCSGHGFKFCSVVGEIITDLVQDGKSNKNIDLFRMERFNT